MMRILRKFVGIITLLILVNVPIYAAETNNTLNGEEKSAGWQLLFDGKTLDHWQLSGTDAWIVQDGVIACRGGDNLFSKQQYGNYFLQCEFKIRSFCNSGIFIRTGDLRNSVATSLEVQIMDDRGPEWPAKKSMGAIYGFQEPLANALRPLGDWNHLLILCLENLVKVRLNGQLIIDLDVNDWLQAHVNPDGTWNKFRTAMKDFPRAGYIGFQSHGRPGSRQNTSTDNIWLRNVKILELAD